MKDQYKFAILMTGISFLVHFLFIFDGFFMAHDSPVYILMVRLQVSPNYYHIGWILYLSLFRLFGDTIFGYQLSTVIDSAICSFFFYLIADHFFDDKRKSICASILFIFFGDLWIFSESAFYRIFMLAFMLAATYFMLQKKPLISFIVFSVSLTISPDAVIYFIVLLYLYFFQKYGQDFYKEGKQLLKKEFKWILIYGIISLIPFAIVTGLSILNSSAQNISVFEKMMGTLGAFQWWGIFANLGIIGWLIIGGVTVLLPFFLIQVKKEARDRSVPFVLFVLTLLIHLLFFGFWTMSYTMNYFPILPFFILIAIEGLFNTTQRSGKFLKRIKWEHVKLALLIGNILLTFFVFFLPQYLYCKTIDDTCLQLRNTASSGDVLFLNRDFYYHYVVYFPTFEEQVVRIDSNQALNNNTLFLEIINNTVVAGKKCYAFKFLTPSRYYGIYDFGNTFDYLYPLIQGQFNFSIITSNTIPSIILLEIKN
ncbi:MAG: hypothetical protein ACTSRW_02280 [Candidatus Helarchaeota archaeon]